MKHNPDDYKLTVQASASTRLRTHQFTFILIAVVQSLEEQRGLYFSILEFVHSPYELKSIV